MKNEKQFLIDDLTQIIRISTYFWLLVFKTVESLLRSFVHLFVRVTLIRSMGRGERGNDQHGNH